MADYRYIRDRRTGTTHRILGVVDNTLTEEGIAADAKVVGDALATKAEVDGYYEEFTAGQAEQLISSVYVEDKVPYNFRTSGGSADIGARAIEKIIGGTIAWNQITDNSTPPSSRGGVTVTANNDGTFTLHGTTNSFAATGWFKMAETVDAYKMLSGHKVLAVFEHVSGTIEQGTKAFSFEVLQISASSRVPCGTSKVFAFPTITEWTTSTRSLIIAGDGIVFTNAKLRILVFDLTRMFGSTIADYIYALEQATAGAGVAWFRSLFPKDYYAYDAGSLQSVKPLKKVSTEFNLLDYTALTWTNAIRGDDGASSDSTSSHYTNPIKVLPNTDYEILGTLHTDATQYRIYYLTESQEWIRRTSTINYAPYQFTTPENCGYIQVQTTKSVTLNDACLHLVWDGSRDGEYEPYVKHEYPLDPDLTLRGIPKLDANNKLYYDGDVYEADGTVNRRYGIIDLGSSGVTYEYNETYSVFVLYENKISPARKPGGKFICAKYVTASTNINSFSETASSPDKSMQYQTTNGNIFIKDSSYTDGATLKTALSGVYLVYELATPTTETADPYQEIQVVDDFGTEEFVDAAVSATPPTRDVAVPVGHETQYQNNLVAKLEMAPESPSDGNGDYVVRHNNGTNEYVKLVIPDELPDNPTTDGNYVLKCTVSDGTATLTWEAQS